MKKYLWIFLILMSFSTKGQNILSKKDSVKILFKAKLLTTSEYGIGLDIKQIINDVENQNALFLKTLYSSFLFIEVEFNQPYRIINGDIVTFSRECSYYLAFNIINSRFYRIGGFDTIDIDTFINDLNYQEDGIFKDVINKNEIEGIDVRCLYRYFTLSTKKRNKKGFECFDNCRNITTTNVGGHEINDSDRY
ncbi:hypothetical protein [Hanstruepera flava]|uniref:hypothetical protein n=1 Tax=Hanstruepera flava TaxID=2930218 RepID=UPI0020291F7D|nr:hypothetical protein [Hanstruepera flava]